MEFSLLSGTASIILLYVISSTIYRLYLSPISKIPGPKIAAATWWYEYYHDIITYGKYIFKVMDMHEEYGPIVRISPYEVHVSDPDFYDTLYASSNANRKERWTFYTDGLGLPVSSLGTVEHNLHKRRRAAMSPFFSKQKVARLQPVVEERARMLVGRLGGLAVAGEIVPLNLAFSAFTSDIVTQYCFGSSAHRIEADGFDPAFHYISFTAGTSNNMMRHNNWMMKLTKALPEKWVANISEEFASFVTQIRDRINQIDEIKRSMMGKKTQEGDETTVFHSMLNSELPASEKSSERLAEEAVLLVGAGTHTTSWSLSVAAYHLLKQPETLRKLKAELEIAIPDPTVATPLPTLEALPYLTAVLKEGLRLGFGNTSRIPRIALDQPMKYGDFEIPTGTPVSMAIPIVHLNEQIFPDARSFHPERWIEDKTGHLDKYLVAFCKGPRMCLGNNLAWSELYVGLSTVFRQLGSSALRGKDDVGVMDLFETDLGDVEMTRDALFPISKDGSKGVRVKMSR